MNEPSPSQHFWTWFSANADTYRCLSADDEAAEPALDAFQSALDRIAPDLFFLINEGEEGHHDLILSPDGNLELFPVIEELVAAAPDIPHWRFIAYRQRGEADVSIQINDFTLGPEQIYFDLAPDGEQVAITLYIADFNLFSSHQLGVASFLLLDNSLGEYDVAKKISTIAREPLPENAPERGLRPLDKLPTAFDAFYEDMRL